jgi:hypothetical protein
MGTRFGRFPKSPAVAGMNVLEILISVDSIIDLANPAGLNAARATISGMSWLDW